MTSEKKNIFRIILLCTCLVIIFLPFGCEKTVEEEAIKPVQRMVEQEDAAAREAAVSNVRQVRAALMRYPITSANNEYPHNSEVYSYDTLREALASEGLPTDIAALMWDPAFGIEYSSDGLSFSLTVMALTKKMEVITGTEKGVTIQ
jgi:hypothetical protein